MPRPLRSSLLTIAFSLALAGCSVSPETDRREACIGPEVEVNPARAAPGEDIELDGEWFFTGCEDVIVDGEPADEELPKQNIEIELHTGPRDWRLAVVDARKDYSFSTTLQVPQDARSGEATVIAESARATLRITGG